MKQRFLRKGHELRDDDVVVIRGGFLDPEVLRTDALRNHAVYGTFGISVFAVLDATLDELEQQAPLVRFPKLSLMTVGAIRAVGLRVEPTGRNPRHFDGGFDDLDEGVSQLCSCEHPVVEDPYHEA